MNYKNFYEVIHILEKQCMLHPNLVKPRYRNSHRHLAGFCYIASEALFYLLDDPTWKPHVMHIGDDTHWFLKNSESGWILDITHKQYESCPNHSLGNPHGFLTKTPSKRAQILIDAVLKEM